MSDTAGAVLSNRTTYVVSAHVSSIDGDPIGAVHVDDGALTIQSSSAAELRRLAEVLEYAAAEVDDLENQAVSA